MTNNTKFVLVLVAAVAMGTLVTSVPAINGNMFLDTLLGVVKAAYGGKFDSFDLPSKTFGWNEQIGLLNLSGQAILHRGFVAGLASLERSSDAALRTLPGGKTAIVSKFTAGPLVATYQGKLAMWGIGPSIKLDVHVKKIGVDVSLLLDETTRKARIVEFKLEQFEGVNAKINSPGFITDKIINLVMKYSLRSLEPAIRYAVSTYLRNSMTNAAATVPLPSGIAPTTDATLPGR